MTMPNLEVWTNWGSIRRPLKMFSGDKRWQCMFAALFAFILMMSEQARANGTGTTADVRCVIVGARLSESTESNQRITAGMLMIYYLGRLDGRSPGVDLQRLIETELGKMTALDFQLEVKRCSDEFSAKGAVVTEIGRNLARLGK
jgi:hypothetical protein